MSGQMEINHLVLLAVPTHTSVFLSILFCFFSCIDDIFSQTKLARGLSDQITIHLDCLHLFLALSMWDPIAQQAF